MMIGTQWSGMFVLALAVSAPAFGSLIVDGDLSDWGISVADNDSSTYSVRPDVRLIGAMQIEDQNDHAGDDAWLGPHRGGQNYDAEMMAVASQGGRIFVAIVTGQRPDNGAARFAPGDLRIEMSSGVYGLEVGGRAGGGPGTLIRQGATGTTYKLNSNGFTTSSAETDAAQSAGSIWSSVTWINSTVMAVPTQFAINGGSRHVADADYVFTRNSFTMQHAVIELSFDASLIGVGQSAKLAWRPSCANDEVVVNALVPVPEPANALFMLLGGLLLRRRR